LATRVANVRMCRNHRKYAVRMRCNRPMARSQSWRQSRH
jgi:hypothetical protein